MTDKQWRWAKVILSLPGAIGFVLPFAYGVSPLEAAMRWPREWPLSFFGVVLGLAFFILAWHLRYAVSGRLSRPEMVACVALGIAGSILIAGNLVYLVIGSGWPSPDQTKAWVGLIVAWCLSAAHVLVVLRYHRRFFTDSDAAVAALMAGYLPNASFCLLIFIEGWQIGAYVVLLACCCYIGMIAATTRRLSLQTIHPSIE